MKETLDELFRFHRRIKMGDTMTDGDSERFVELYDTAAEFISSIENDYASECLMQRYIDGKQWGEIADAMGQETTDAVRKCCSRAVKKYS